VDDLLKVKGIGPKNLEKIRPYVVVSKEQKN
jgi:DNA uptake protein ComE-like DNA-binding protein